MVVFLSGILLLKEAFPIYYLRDKSDLRRLNYFNSGKY